jgi:antitoxin component YwqK of YwqJK toxin-antitoxin module
MATTISYQNFYEEPITEQQLNALNEYYKVYSINGIVKKKEFYSNGELKELEYIKDQSENINDIFTALGTNDLAVTQFEQIGNYNIETCQSFHNGIVLVTEKFLRLNDRIICEQLFDSNNIPKLESTVKNLYDNSGKEIYEFYYNEGGSLDSVQGHTFHFSENGNSMKASEFLLYFSNFFADNPYYANANFMP